MSNSIHGERSIFSEALRREKSFDRVAQGLFGSEPKSGARKFDQSYIAMRTRALKRPEHRASAWQLPPRYDGQLFQGWSSFGRDFAVSIVPATKTADLTTRVEDEYAKRKTLKIGYDDAAPTPAPRRVFDLQAPKQYRRFDRPPCTAIMVPTRWGGTRNIYKKGYTVKGVEYPDEVSEVPLPGFRTDAPIQDRLRPRPSSSPAGSTKVYSANEPLRPYGTERLANTHTCSHLIALRERVYDMHVKQKRAKQNLGRRMYSDERRTYPSVQAE